MTFININKALLQKGIQLNQQLLMYHFGQNLYTRLCAYKASQLSRCAYAAYTDKAGIKNGLSFAADFFIRTDRCVGFETRPDKSIGKVSSHYWSSSTNVNNANNAWNVNFNNGNVNNNNKTNSNYVRCVSGA